MAFVCELREFPSRPDVPPLGEARPLSSNHIYDSLMAKRKSTFTKGRQEDAEEFLGFLISDLNEEIKSLASSAVESLRLPSEKRNLIARRSYRELTKADPEKFMFKNVCKVQLLRLSG